MLVCLRKHFASLLATPQAGREARAAIQTGCCASYCMINVPCTVLPQVFQLVFPADVSGVLPHYARQLSDAASALCHCIKAVLHSESHEPEHSRKRVLSGSGVHSSVISTTLLQHAGDHPSKRLCRSDSSRQFQQQQQQQDLPQYSGHKLKVLEKKQGQQPGHKQEQTPVEPQQQQQQQQQQESPQHPGHKLQEQEQEQQHGHKQEQSPVELQPQQQQQQQESPQRSRHKLREQEQELQQQQQQLYVMESQSGQPKQQEATAAPGSSVWQALVSVAVHDANALQQDLANECGLEGKDVEPSATQGSLRLGDEEDFCQLAALSDFALITEASAGEECCRV